MRFSTLNDWLSWQETLHPKEIELGLDRVKQVWLAMQANLSVPVISIAGTNGKGSSIAFLQAIYSAAGYHVGSYTSPHLYQYNERICINGLAVNDADIVQAFGFIDQARAEISLTYFEFGTLAALYLFALQMQREQPLDVVLLEVGLGGRLDAVNIIDADLAMITSVDLDHQNWLGETRALIAMEKAGILRQDKPCVICDPDTPQEVAEQARKLGCRSYVCGKDYNYVLEAGYWQWSKPSPRVTRAGLPMPSLNGQHQLQNAAGVLMAVDLLAADLPVSQQAIREGLLDVRIHGRFEIMHHGDTTTIMDVAHNQAAATVLAQALLDYGASGRISCLFSILADKDIAEVVAPLLAICGRWSIAGLDQPRAASLLSIKNQLLRLKPELDLREHDSVQGAYQFMLDRAEPGDILLVFGSFYTVAEAGGLAV